MIDAYEIGIQLALQDGVSAGLETISRELADVDRAIAATTAGLEALTRSALTASRSAAAIEGTRVPRVPLTPGNDSEVETPETPTLSRQEWSTAAVVNAVSKEKSSTSSNSGSTVVLPDAQDGSTVSVHNVKPMSELATVQSGEASSPPKIGSYQTILNDVSLTSAPLLSSAPVESTALARTPIASAANSELKLPIPAVGPSAEMTPSTSAPVQKGALTITASVKSAIVPSAAAPELLSADTPATLQDDRSQGAFRNQRALAPAGTNTRVVRALSVASSQERAAAPQAQPGDPREGGTGTVMLDGRLVGYWLSEQMAREASRPPGGTTFFDPRQSPAWNSSGAL